uniref:Chemokine (C-X-C motif) receptor 3, tandem duplicate 2 n=1 Tax=Callorhinchus milii TaxID=7868 RepID=A0A4W3GDZ9_CALMI
YDTDFNLYDLELASPCLPSSVDAFSSVFTPAVYALVFLEEEGGEPHSKIGDLFVTHLALSDVVLLLTLPLWAAESVSSWVFGTVLCKAVGAMFLLSLYSSSFFLVCISVDRYLSIVHAVQLYRRRKPLHASLTTAGVWAASLALSCLELGYRKVQTSVYLNRSTCSYAFDPEVAGRWYLALRLVHHLACFLLPISVMFYCYCMVFRTVCRAHMQAKRKTLRLVVSIVAVFLCCWLPYNTVIFLDTLVYFGGLEPSCRTVISLDLARTVTQTLGLTHACLNPLLYAFVGVRFRQEVKELLGLSSRGRWGSGRRGILNARRSQSVASDSETSSTYYSMW